MAAAPAYSLIGKPIPRVEGRDKVSGAATYTVDVVLPKEEYDRIKEHPCNKTFTFDVREIRVGRGARFRFDARLELPQSGK